MIGLCACLFCPATSFSQNESATPRALMVGAIVAPPLYMKTADNRWEGFAVELWQAVAQHIGVPFEFREFSTFEHLLDSLEKREIDVIPSLPVRERFESTMDFSQSYLKSGLSIAVAAEGVEYRWFRIFESIFSKHTLKAIGFLVLLSLITGTIVWSFERRKNSEMFGDGTVGGIGHGIWWAMVTMTTVGYGDKAPKTMGGRITALIWMIFSIIFIASFTANITTSLTITELRGKVRGFNDLYNVSTPDPFTIISTDEWPTTGTMLCEGSGNTKAVLSAVDSVSYRIEADTNGDNVYDYDSGVLLWANL